MEDNKMFDLMEKMYSELQSTKKEMQEGFKEVKGEIAENRNAIVKLESKVTENNNAIVKLESKIESEISDKVRGLFDAREVTNDKLDRIDEKLDGLQVDVNSLTIKTAVGVR